jgi:hypothetical protein
LEVASPRSLEEMVPYAVARGRHCSGERNGVVRLHVVVDIFWVTNHDVRWSTNRR